MLFLDCEFDGHNGPLISMGIVSTDGDEFYEVLPHKNVKDGWVKDNVIPKLDKDPINSALFRVKLHLFLQKHKGELIFADSPADFIHLLDRHHWLDIVGKYCYANLELSMHFVISGETTPEVPHNALSDAKALMNWYLNCGEVIDRHPS